MLNMDFTKTLALDTGTMQWVPSPQQGVLRKPLAREDRESGHATSIVKYSAGADFPIHQHPAGEEILVLSGVFSDESGDYPAGTYLRNPAGSSHAPFSREGCELLVKLCQFSPGDTRQFSVATGAFDEIASVGRGRVNLHCYAEEEVFMLPLSAGEILTAAPQRAGQEFLVLSGHVKVEQGCYTEGYWVRSPVADEITALKDSLIWIKRGHLPRSD